MLEMGWGGLSVYSSLKPMHLSVTLTEGTMHFCFHMCVSVSEREKGVRICACLRVSDSPLHLPTVHLATF